MRDARPFHFKRLVYRYCFAVVFSVELVPELFEAVGGGVSTFGGAFVDFALKGGEHRLAVYGGADVFEAAVEQVEALFPVVGLGEEAGEEEHFVRRRCHLGCEDAVVCCRVGLVSARVPAVHGVAHFVDEREHVVEVVGVVHEDVRMRAVGAP